MQPKKKKPKVGQGNQIDTPESFSGAASGRNGEKNGQKKVSSVVVGNVVGR
jgi:hypothetical protein